MSRGITWRNFADSLKRAVETFRSMGRMELSRDQGMIPVVNLDSYLAEGLPNDLLAQDKFPIFSDYPIGVPSLEFVSRVEPFGVLPFDGVSAAEGIMPLEFPVITSIPKVSAKTPRKPVPVALPYKEIPELPLPIQSKAPQEPAMDKSSLENLLLVLEESGMKAKEIKPLPSGITKITLDDLLKSGQSREPELVRVRR